MKKRADYSLIDHISIIVAVIAIGFAFHYSSEGYYYLAAFLFFGGALLGFITIMGVETRSEKEDEEDEKNNQA